MDEERVKSYTGIHSLPETATYILEELDKCENSCIHFEYLEDEEHHNSVMNSWLRIFEKSGILQYKDESIYK